MCGILKSEPIYEFPINHHGQFVMLQQQSSEVQHQSH